MARNLMVVTKLALETSPVLLLYFILLSLFIISMAVFACGDKPRKKTSWAGGAGGGGGCAGGGGGGGCGGGGGSGGGGGGVSGC